MKNYLLFIIILISLINLSCEKQVKDKISNDEIELFEIELPDPKSIDSLYLKNPSLSDTLCINDIKKAKSDLNTHKGIFTCYDCSNEPFHEHLRKIIDKKGFKLYIEDTECVRYKNQTNGCYSGYVDLVMKKKYGINYYQKIIDEAKEKLIIDLIENDSVIHFYELEDFEKPKLKHSNSELMNIDYTGPIKFDKPLNHDNKTPMYVSLQYIVEKNGEISNLKLKNIEYGNIKNQSYKSDLIISAKNELNRNYSKWIPATYEGYKIRSLNTLTVYFK